MRPSERLVADRMRDQQSLITLKQAVAAGMTPAQVQARVRSARWIRLHPGVFAPVSAAVTPERELLAAYLAAGPPAAASHLSAAWLLGLTTEPPKRPVITVPYSRTVRLEGVRVHRSRDLDMSRTLVRRGIRYTDPLRILTDVAGELPADKLHPILDRALATRLVTVDGLLQEIGRRRRKGRSGPNRLDRALRFRGFAGGPAPSVLEADTMRLFQRWGIPVAHREMKVAPDGRYRIDFLIVPGLAVEVDGFAHHWSPEDKAYDDARRNRLRLSGLVVLVYDWRAVRFEERRLANEILDALGRLARAI